MTARATAMATPFQQPVRQAARAVWLSLSVQDPQGWAAVAVVAAVYCETVRAWHPHPPAPADVIGESEEIVVVVRGSAAAGFGAIGFGAARDGERVCCIRHLWAPGDLGAQRALVRAIEERAREEGCGAVVFESADLMGFGSKPPSPRLRGPSLPKQRTGMREAAAGFGFRPVAMIYAKEL